VSTSYRYIRFFKEIGIEDVPSVGGKNASLGEMYRELTPKGVLVPNGFAITAQAYGYVLEKAGITARLREALEGLQPDDVEERDEGVKEMIRLAVEGCKRNHRHSGLCGQAPSDYPEMARYLIEIGIDSISLNPDAVLKTTLNVLEVARQLGRRAPV